jgi:hypothetical protein
MALVVPQTLLWRARWMLPGAVNGALFLLAIALAVRWVLQPLEDRTPVARSLLAVSAALIACVTLTSLDSSRVIALEGSVERLSKLQPTTHQIADALGGPDSSVFLLCPYPQESRLAWELVQLMPRIRLIISRRIAVRWYLGTGVLAERLHLMSDFYYGGMSLEEFAALRERFPVDWAIVDEMLGRPEGQRATLQEAGWQRVAQFERYEVWRLPQ